MSVGTARPMAPLRSLRPWTRKREGAYPRSLKPVLGPPLNGDPRKEGTSAPLPARTSRLIESGGHPVRGDKKGRTARTLFWGGAQRPQASAVVERARVPATQVGIHSEGGTDAPRARARRPDPRAPPARQ